MLGVGLDRRKVSGFLSAQASHRGQKDALQNAYAISVVMRSSPLKVRDKIAPATATMAVNAADWTASEMMRRRALVVELLKPVGFTCFRSW